jgi:hypothetical protein
MMSNEWAEEVLHAKDLHDLSLTSERIVRDNENGLTVNLGLSNEFCINLCQRWTKAMRFADWESTIMVHAFFQSFIDYLDEYLKEEGIDFREYPES